MPISELSKALEATEVARMNDHGVFISLLGCFQANARAKEKSGKLQQARQWYRRAIVVDRNYAPAYQVSIMLTCLALPPHTTWDLWHLSLHGDCCITSQHSTAQHSTPQRTNEQHSPACQSHRYSFHELPWATPLVQGIAYLESNQGNYRAAQQLFQQGTDKCPPHAPLFNAWASMEVSPCIKIALNVLCARHSKPHSMHV